MKTQTRRTKNKVRKGNTKKPDRKQTTAVVISPSQMVVPVTPTAMLKALQKIKIGFTSWAVLDRLCSTQGPKTPTELSVISGTSTAAITGMTKKWAELGFVSRTHSTEDLRKVLITPLPKGFEAVATVKDAGTSFMQSLMTKPENK